MKLTNTWINGDCLKELKKMPDESVDLVITSPPYHNLRVYSNDPSDLSNCESYEEYYYLLGLVIAECQPVVHAKWVLVRKYRDEDGYINEIFRCSNCEIPRDAEFSYCPSCGAKMCGNEVE